MKGLEDIRLKYLKEIERSILQFLFRNFFTKSIRRTRHFQEWFREPMNYVRLAEIPLARYWLDPGKSDIILDISSPKLLSLDLAINGFNILSTDSNDYFIDDFKRYSELYPNLKAEVFDCLDIPYRDEYFDKIFSISVLEHIPYDGDLKAINEISRVLKKNGIAVITLPAYYEYLEEWQREKRFYWETAKNARGEFFYQRRYTKDRISQMVSKSNLFLDDLIFIAENPIGLLEVDKNGVLRHNAFYLSELVKNQYFNKRPFRKLPVLPYLNSRKKSLGLQYFTANPSDKNIRQVVIKLVKK